MKQRVLYVIDHTGSGGAQAVAYDLLRAFKDRYSLAVAVLGGSGQFSEAYKALGVPVFELGDGHGRWNPSPLLDLIRIIRRDRYDLIHTYLFKSYILGAIAAACTGCRIILHDETGIHPQSLQHYFSNPLIRYSYLFAYRYALYRCNRAIVLTPKTLQMYLHYYRVEQQKIMVVPNAVDIHKFDQASKNMPAPSICTALGLSTDTRLVTMVGRLEPEKDWWTFLKVAQQVKHESNQSCTFLVVGSGTEEDVLRNYIHTERLEQDVFFLGYRDDVPMLLRQTDIFLLTSRREEFPLVLLEAMAAGCPVVATRSGGPESIVTDGVDGLLAEVGDVQALAKHIVCLLQDDTLRQGLIQRARKTVAARYSVESAAMRVDKIYKEILEP